MCGSCVQVALVLNIELEAWLSLGNQQFNRESRINAQFRHSRISFEFCSASRWVEMINHGQLGLASPLMQMPLFLFWELAMEVVSLLPRVLFALTVDVAAPVYQEWIVKDIILQLTLFDITARSKLGHFT